MSARDRLGMARLLLRLAVAGALTLGAVLCPVAAAAHSPGHYFLRPYRAIRFRIHGSHGYVIGVAEGSRGHFAVTVRGRGATTEYEVRSKARSEPRDGVRGRLGTLGSVDVRFTPRGKPHRLPRYAWCTGPGPMIQPGIVRGKIRFRGERGYTRAFANQAKAELETTPGQRCHYGEEGRSKHPHRYTAVLEAYREEESPTIGFSARRFTPRSRPPARRAFYEANTFARRGSLFVRRRVWAAAGTSTFRLPNFATAPETAVIQPPEPFTGSAMFNRTPESTFAWSGDLAVAFPGIDPIPLTGPTFRLYYCAVGSCITQEPPASVGGGAVSIHDATR